ncbi:MAG: phosphatidylinositol-specific phospholipase C/glycerophosphodiester phosphodiesterase family protein, partial [Fimbriimonadales bacterium]
MRQAPLLTRAHSHNDYWRQRPLADALECGFCSVEVDIFLQEGKLLVGHDLHELRPERTLQSLYLEPLRERAKRYRGQVYPNAPFFYLLIDIKSAWEPTYDHLRKILESYDDLFTRYEGDRRFERAVHAVLSGNRPPIQRLSAERVRFASYDGRLSDLGKSVPPSLMPWVSDNWMLQFRWQGRGTMPTEERDKLAQLVQRAQSQGYKLRFWAAADIPPMWDTLWEASYQC